MNDANLFYPHEPDSRIAIKKDKAEVNNWIDDLDYINDELDYLLDIEDCMLNNRGLYQQLHAIRRENMLKLGILRRYESNMQNAMECDTTECDAFYLSNHEKNRNLYVDHVKKYRFLKTKVLSKILLNAKRAY